MPTDTTNGMKQLPSQLMPLTGGEVSRPQSGDQQGNQRPLMPTQHSQFGYRCRCTTSQSSGSPSPQVDLDDDEIRPRP